MARRLTDNDILAIQECYSKIGTYSGVAKELGFSPSTVKKYVLLDQSPKTAEEKKEIFSYQQQYEYPYKKVTSRYKVPFYVGNEFLQKYNGKKKELLEEEKRIERNTYMQCMI